MKIFSSFQFSAFNSFRKKLFLGYLTSIGCRGLSASCKIDLYVNIYDSHAKVETAMFDIRNIDFKLTISLCPNSKSSHPDVFYKRGVLRNFAKFTGKHLCQSPFFNKVAGLRPERLWHRCFPVNFMKFLRTPFFIEHL